MFTPVERRMRGADCSSESSQSLQEASSVLPADPSPLSSGLQWPALFPVKEDIYDLDYPELQELQKKLVHYLDKATPTCPHRTSATGLLRLVKLEIQERQSCAFMLENIISMQNTYNSHDGRNTRGQDSADASASATSSLTTAPRADVKKTAAEGGTVIPESRPSVITSHHHANIPKTISATGPRVLPGTLNHSNTNKSSISPTVSPFRRGISSLVSSTVCSVGNTTCFSNPEISLDLESSKKANRSASTSSNAFKPDVSPTSLPKSAQPVSRVSNFAVLAKKLFGDVSPRAPTSSVRVPTPVPPCDAQVACAPPLKIVKRSRRKTGAKHSGRKCGSTQDPQKKSRRKCLDKLPSDNSNKGSASCSIKHCLSKEKLPPRETTSLKTSQLDCGSAASASAVPVADTQGNTNVNSSPNVAEATSAAPQEEKQRYLPSKKGLDTVTRSSLSLSFEEQRDTEASSGRRDKNRVRGISEVASKTETFNEEKTKPLGNPTKSEKAPLYTEQRGSADRTTATSLPDSTPSSLIEDNSSDTRTSCSTGLRLPLAGSIGKNDRATLSGHGSTGVPLKPKKKSSSFPPVDSILTVQGNRKDAPSPPPATRTPPTQNVEVVATTVVEVDNIVSGDSVVKTRSRHLVPVTSQPENERQRFLRRLSRSCTDDSHRKRAAAAHVDNDEGDGREKERSVYCMAGSLLARNLLIRRDARRQRSSSTGTTQKKAPVKQKREGGATGELALTTAEDIDFIGSGVYHELAHMSIRNSARGVIGDIDSIIQSMSLKAGEQQRLQQENKATQSGSAAGKTKHTTMPAASTEGTASAAMPPEHEQHSFTCSAVPRCCTEDEGHSEQGDTVKKVNSNNSTSTPSDSDSHSVQQIGQNETDRILQFYGKAERTTDHLLPDGCGDDDASVEKVYALLAALDGHPSIENCSNRSRTLHHSSSVSSSKAFGWRIQIGNEDDVDAMCQTISIRKTQVNELDDSRCCLMVEEQNISPSRGVKYTNNRDTADRIGGLNSSKQESKRWSSPTQWNRHLSLSLRDTNGFIPQREASKTEGCDHNGDNSLLWKIQCQFPTLADLLTEGDKTRHANVLREILINNGKCCADICRLEGSKREQGQTLDCASDCNSNHALVTRFYKVEKNRPEVFSIVCRALKEEERWRPVPEGQHWEYGWNLLWTWRPPRINYNRLLTFQKVNHFPEGRHLTRKDKLKSCIERYQKLAGKRSDLFNIIPKSYLIPKEHTALFNDMCEAEERKQKSIWICKPKDGSRGRGIYLADSIGKIKYGDNILVQEYISNPLLLNGRKFDLRLYVLVTSFNPLEAFVYKEGFARVARVPFSLDPEHLDNRFMHLTNASVQTQWQNPCESEEDEEETIFKDDVLEDDSPSRIIPRVSNSVENKNERDLRHSGSLGGESSKLVLDELRIRLEQSGMDWDALWHRIVLVILKSLSCCSDYIPFQPNSFELFGYDILIDAEGKPWLIEVNSSPCMSQEFDIDREIKPTLIEDTIRLVNPVIYDRFKLSTIIAGRLPETLSTPDIHNTSLISPHRRYNKNTPNELSPSSSSSACNISSLSSSSSVHPTSSSSSSSRLRRGLLTHRPSRRATPDVHQRSDERKITTPTTTTTTTTTNPTTTTRRGSSTSSSYVKKKKQQQQQQDLLDLLQYTKPREYGELPAALGKYERIAPSKTWYQLQLIKQNLLGKHHKVDHTAA